MIGMYDGDKYHKFREKNLYKFEISLLFMFVCLFVCGQVMECHAALTVNHYHATLIMHPQKEYDRAFRDIK